MVADEVEPGLIVFFNYAISYPVLPEFSDIKFGAMHQVPLFRMLEDFYYLFGSLFSQIFAKPAKSFMLFFME